MSTQGHGYMEVLGWGSYVPHPQGRHVPGSFRGFQGKQKVVELVETRRTAKSVQVSSVIDANCG